jgi:hypothetical protein
MPDPHMTSAVEVDDPHKLVAYLHDARHDGCGSDPVLCTLADLAAQRDTVQRSIRVVLAYARTATRPRPYTLRQLADATGLSISGVRIAFGDADIALVRTALKQR